ncbi:MAG: hypothetical protein ACYDH6_11085 [Acidimicrobiales bacterium]
MDDRTADLALRLLGAALIIGGLIAVLIGYLGVRDHSDVVLQVPYFMSGGVGGLALMGLGALAFVQYQMRVQTRRYEAVTESLDEWKEAALAEIRGFLEGASIEIEVRDTTARSVRRATPAGDGRRSAS